MSENKTELERGGCEDATVLESGDGLGRTVLESSGGGGGGMVGLQAGDEFVGYRIVSWLQVKSLESEIYVVESVATGQRYVLKLYRRNFHPNENILKTVRAMPRGDIVEIFATGTKDGLFYEIQEYVEHGSLANMLEVGALTEAKVRQALEEICKALAHLHAVEVLHRDLKPSNILVRAKEPVLNLVLTDFGLSRETTLSSAPVSRVGGTVAYSAPEASTKWLLKKSDWWSVGIIVIEMLTGCNPFSGYEPQAIVHHVIFRPVPIPEEISLDWQLLVKGLLTKDPEKRWGHREVFRWLDGERDMPVHFETQVAGPVALHNYKPYSFNGQEFFRPEDLAITLAKNWNEAVKRIGRLGVLKWVKEQYGDDDMANMLQDVADDRNLDEYQRTTVSLMVLNPHLPPIWEDSEVTIDWAQRTPRAAIPLLVSTFPRWMKALRKDSSWLALRSRLLSIRQQTATIPNIDRDLAESLSLFPAERVQLEAKKLQSQIHSAFEPAIQALVEKSDLRDSEAIQLLASNKTVFWTKEQEAERCKEEELRRQAIGPIFEKWLRKHFFRPAGLSEAIREVTADIWYVPYWVLEAKVSYFWTEEREERPEGESGWRYISDTKWRKVYYASETYWTYISAANWKGTEKLKFEREDMVPHSDEILRGWKLMDLSLTEEQAKGKYVDKFLATKGYLSSVKLSAPDFNASYIAYMPLWNMSYECKGKKYSAILNEKTGAIRGRKPLCPKKITVAIILIAVVVCCVLVASGIFPVDWSGILSEWEGWVSAIKSRFLK